MRSPACRCVSRTAPLTRTRLRCSFCARARVNSAGFGTINVALLTTAVLAIVLATILSYAVARSVTRPLGTITATMREVAATGDLTRKIDLPGPSWWQDEDARLVAATFNNLTDRSRASSARRRSASGCCRSAGCRRSSRTKCGIR